MQRPDYVNQRREECVLACLSHRGDGLQHALNAQRPPISPAGFAERVAVTQHAVAFVESDVQFSVANLVDNAKG